MTIIDRGCWERGCACYDSRVADETVEVAPRNDVLEEVAKEFDAMKMIITNLLTKRKTGSYVSVADIELLDDLLKEVNEMKQDD